MKMATMDSTVVMRVEKALGGTGPTSPLTTYNIVVSNANIAALVVVSLALGHVAHRAWMKRPVIDILSIQEVSPLRSVSDV